MANEELKLGASLRLYVVCVTRQYNGGGGGGGGGGGVTEFTDCQASRVVSVELVFTFRDIVTAFFLSTFSFP